MFSFEIFHTSEAGPETAPSGRARVGRFTTPHGSFDTPAFMPVGTKGTVKGILPHLVASTGAQILLNNTYHMLLRPGPETVHRLGGVHRFMGWPGPILTDSGGYQAFSMSDTNSVDDDGVTFKSIVDGAMIRLTPERAIEVQNLLGADIIMAFDDCPPSAEAPGEAKEAAGHEAPGRDAGAREPAETDEGDGGSATAQPRVDPRLRRAIVRDSSRRGYDHQQRLAVANERTVRWLERCKAAHTRPDQALFGIVQGGTDLERRSWSAERICNIELSGYAIGGVAVGETSGEIARVVRHTAPLLPRDKPRYLMGVGYERDLLAAVRAGVDMFDCVLPTRNGRNANAFTPRGQVRLKNAQYAEDPRPVDETCDCPACTGEPDLWRWALAKSAPGDTRREMPKPFSRAYLRHLFMAEEMLGPILLTLHNLRHFQRFMADIRATIVSGDWEGLEARWPVARAAE
jgi:queuine tRNA-ribosyltransferase